MVTGPVSRVAAAVVSPLRAFLHAESAGGIVLVRRGDRRPGVGQQPGWRRLLRPVAHDADAGAGRRALSLDLQHWVNDGLMGLFFFVIGLEIKRELVVGELRDPRAAALPALAAVAAWSCCRR